MTDEERGRVKGLIINKFRGDLSLLTPGLDFLTQRTGLPILGVLPYLQLELPEEDSQGLHDHQQQNKNLPPINKINIGVLKLPRISNFTDFDALTAEPDVELKFISTMDQLASCDLIIIPGTKNTTADLEWLHKTGLAAKIQSLATTVIIFGICGGYQMLGAEIRDPLHLESELERVEGLNLLPISTDFKATTKVTRQVKGVWRKVDGQTVPISGYEIHQGMSGIMGSRIFFTWTVGWTKVVR